MSQEDIEKSLRNCLKENVYNVLANSALANSAQSLKNKRQIAKQAASLVNTVVSSLSNTSQSSITSQEHMEIDLRDKLLEIEEQIFIGALGSLKVNDRYKWKEALEKGQYDASCTNLVWGGDLTRPALECTNRAGNLKTPVTSILSSQQNASLDAPLDTETMNVYIVNNFAKVLLQIEQSMEKRFIRMPLGDAHKTPDKRRGQTKSKTMTNGGGAGDSEANSGETSGGPNAGNSLAASKQYSTLFHWEKSLMNCTTLSQIFIHLQTLDESIAWSKSALNAKCRICKKKGEPEKMILCDKCDHGHHIFCLRPPLSSIPDGEWFCPKCRPKDVEKTPRKIRKSFINCELYSDESGNEMYDSETDNNSHR
jgi:bromodomain adjacent to zinc finger domain protein 1A